MVIAQWLDQACKIFGETRSDRSEKWRRLSENLMYSTSLIASANDSS